MLALAIIHLEILFVAYGQIGICPVEACFVKDNSGKEAGVRGGFSPQQ
jgi:hypothetical protein